MQLKFASAFILVICLLFIGCEKVPSEIESETVEYTQELRPGAADGMDAFVYDYEPDRNLGTHPDFMTAAWTGGGSEILVRNFIRFDLSNIPTDATVTSAKLSLYSYDSPSNGMHSMGNNASTLKKVMSSWTEDAVTWNNQPSSSDESQIFLTSSDSEIQDYLDIDATDMVKEMVANPAENFGFVLRIDTEETYRRMVFASSDNPNSDLHPKLDIEYSVIE